MSNFITNLLLIKDQNITMEDKLDLINVDGQDTFVFHGTLSYNPKCCPNWAVSRFLCKHNLMF